MRSSVTAVSGRRQLAAVDGQLLPGVRAGPQRPCRQGPACGSGPAAGHTDFAARSARKRSCRAAELTMSPGSAPRLCALLQGACHTCTGRWTWTMGRPADGLDRPSPGHSSLGPRLRRTGPVSVWGKPISRPAASTTAPAVTGSKPSTRPARPSKLRAAIPRSRAAPMDRRHRLYMGWTAAGFESHARAILIREVIRSQRNQDLPQPRPLRTPRTA